MALNPWKASQDVITLVEHVKLKNHSPRLSNAVVAICFNDGKPFLRNKLNLGKLSKFSPLARLWHGQQHDFCLSIPMELWNSVLKTPEQKEAYLDLQLTRCTVEYKPQEIEENNKKKKVKDEWGRIQYTDEPLTDDEGNPKWQVSPFDLEVLVSNVRRYGLWCDLWCDLRDAIISAPGATDAPETNT